MRLLLQKSPDVAYKAFLKIRKYAQSKRYNSQYAKILGIETSCDDTGCAIVNTSGKILGESLESQQMIHTLNGGIIPPIARDLHAQNIEKVVKEALQVANLSLKDIDAIATTVKPGLPLSLLVGMKYGKRLSVETGKPFIPIHHMEAHALTARMANEQVRFPFLVLLISGGHSLLAVAQDIDKFLLLGKTLDDAPGEAFDKIARRLKLGNIPEVRHLSGGQALETIAKRGDPKAFKISEPLLHYKDCNFSFAGIKNSTRTVILQEEEKHGIIGDQRIPQLEDMCASVQYAITKHIVRRVIRAMKFCEIEDLLPSNPTLVVSGGVACNKAIKSALDVVCNGTGYTLSVPPPKLCTDNGIMIAWNGIEKWKCKKDIYEPSCLDEIDIVPKCPFGIDIIESVKNANIKVSSAAMKEINQNPPFYETGNQIDMKI